MNPPQAQENSLPLSFTVALTVALTFALTIAITITLTVAIVRKEARALRQERQRQQGSQR